MLISHAIAEGIIKPGAKSFTGKPSAEVPSDRLFGMFNGSAHRFFPDEPNPKGGVGVFLYVRQEGVHYTDEFKAVLQERARKMITDDVEAKRIK